MGLAVLRPTCPLSPGHGYMLYGPIFCLIYRYTLVLISALFNANLDYAPNLFVLLYISSFLLFEQAISHSRYPYIWEQVFPDFQLQIQVQDL